MGNSWFLGCWQDKHRRVGDGALVVTVVDDKIEKVVTIVLVDLNPYIWDIEDCFYMSLELTTVGC